MTELLCLAISLGIFMLFWKARLNYLLLGRLPQVDNSGHYNLTVDSAAYAETHQISWAPDVAVIVVDDCLAGAATADCKWILLVVAGTTLNPSFVASAVAFAESNGYDVLTAYLEKECVTLVQKMLLPYLSALYFTGVGARVTKGNRDLHALSTGQCMLFRRSAYEQMYGNTSVLSNQTEEADPARIADQKGLALRVIRAEHLGRVRMYATPHGTWRGFYKSLRRFRSENLAGGVQVIAIVILLTSWLPALLLGFRDYPADLSLKLLLTPTPVLLLLLAPFLTLLPWYAESRITKAWRVLLAPFAIYVFPLIALSAMLVPLIRRTRDWKGSGV